MSRLKGLSAFLRHKTSAFWQHLLERMQSLRGTPQSIAAGFACGVAVSFTPFLGFHCILAALAAWFIKGNILASAIGTVAGNPWTFPFIWISVLYTGRHILGIEYDQNTQIDFIHFFERATRALLSFDFKTFLTDVWPILWPMMIGCIPFVIMTWYISYRLMKAALVKLGSKHIQSIENKANKLRN